MIYIDIEHKIFTSEGEVNMKVKTHIPEKSLVGITGYSGVGKTTLLRILAGLIQPDKGLIELDGNIVFDSKNRIDVKPQKRKLSFMFQDYALFPNMNVEENISFAQKHKDKVWIDELIEIFGLQTFRKQPITKLSGGQKQRVALGRALAAKPKILLLDEPLSSLNEEMREILQQEILKAHHLFKTTTLMVSHNKEEIEKMGSIILSLGQQKDSEYYFSITKNKLYIPANDAIMKSVYLAKYHKI